jgi:hypothetical protein
MLDIGDINFFSWGKEFGRVLIPEVGFTSLMIHFMLYSHHISNPRILILNSSYVCKVDMGSACPMLQAICSTIIPKL